ncbi:carboxymuconolactone decarboxylase family protein [Solwaraspora sp. WMMD1047]|uniref:carboxymuconolactone decarboxylase family protein n=1 Tax=Solwaraspora sp. WMMD1047 TaxID=3016102 RepID=UPI0024170F6E|nr:carboxymuconolactone decarboxylase family protein [Solwaraspora sp. WMMD1047]MDG4832530.1 carboxymuconolactone decarboxylase family protein [Solwaraspora sp. WMMD1047]
MSDDDSRLERGNRVRREVLGDAHVDRSMLAATDFTRVVQEYVTASCWGDVWSRPGLDRRTRSLLNLAMLTALNRPHEFTVHIRGALRNGCTEAEIQEALLQTAAYCGAPAALESFRLAERTIEEVRQEAAAAGSSTGNAAVGVVAG